MQSVVQLGNIRRSRGYNFEYSVVQRFNETRGWQARRLGGSSTGLPDIVAVNNERSTLLTIEAKSGTGDILYVPPDQIERCLLIRDMFGAYQERKIIFAFKFLGKKRYRRGKQTVYEQRRLVEYFKVADSIADKKSFPIVKCTYDGQTFVLSKSKNKEINLPDFNMPFNGIMAKAKRSRALSVSAPEPTMALEAEIT